MCCFDKKSNSNYSQISRRKEQQ
uniref:Uncharacterized protein n=1 Tax=Rhizophora mucronata TaxID=61149 RepID=A0A2P2IKW3_RHIMU